MLLTELLFLLQGEPESVSIGTSEVVASAFSANLPPSDEPTVTANRGAQGQAQQYDASCPSLIAAGHTATAAPEEGIANQRKSGPRSVSAEVSEAMPRQVHFLTTAASAVNLRQSAEHSPHIEMGSPIGCAASTQKFTSSSISVAWPWALMSWRSSRY